VHEREVLIEQLTDGGQLHADLRPGGQTRRGQRVEQFLVGTHGLLGEPGVGGVLTQVVERDGESGVDEPACHADRVGRGLAGYESAHHVPAHRCGRDDPTDHVVAGRGQDQAT
jgi:hypothetical protein